MGYTGRRLMHKPSVKCTLCDRDLNEGDEVMHLTGKDAEGRSTNPCCKTCWGPLEDKDTEFYSLGH